MCSVSAIVTPAWYRTTRDPPAASHDSICRRNRAAARSRLGVPPRLEAVTRADEVSRSWTRSAFLFLPLVLARSTIPAFTLDRLLLCVMMRRTRPSRAAHVGVLVTAAHLDPD